MAISSRTCSIQADMPPRSAKRADGGVYFFLSDDIVMPFLDELGAFARLEVDDKGSTLAALSVPFTLLVETSDERVFLLSDSGARAMGVECSDSPASPSSEISEGIARSADMAAAVFDSGAGALREI